MPQPVRLTRRRDLLADVARHPDATTYLVPASFGYIPSAIAMVIVMAALTIFTVTAPGLAGNGSLAGRIVVAVFGGLFTGGFVQVLLAPKILIENDGIVVVRATRTYEIPWTDLESAKSAGDGAGNLLLRLTSPRQGLAVDPHIVAWSSVDWWSFYGLVTPHGRSSQLADLINTRRAANLGRYPPATTSHVVTRATRPTVVAYCATAATVALYLVIAFAV